MFAIELIDDVVVGVVGVRGDVVVDADVVDVHVVIQWLLKLRLLVLLVLLLMAAVMLWLMLLLMMLLLVWLMMSLFPFFVNAVDGVVFGVVVVDIRPLRRIVVVDVVIDVVVDVVVDVAVRVVVVVGDVVAVGLLLRGGAYFYRVLWLRPRP